MGLQAARPESKRSASEVGAGYPRRPCPTCRPAPSPSSSATSRAAPGCSSSSATSGYAQHARDASPARARDFAAHGGSEIDTQGDAFFYSFAAPARPWPRPSRCSAATQTQEWPDGVKVRVRLGLHTGEPVVGEEGYTGLDVVRAARIAADGKGGQILLSEATRAIVGDDLPEGVGVRELGERTLKDIDQPEPMYELCTRRGAREEPDRSQRSRVDGTAEEGDLIRPTSAAGCGIAPQAIRQGDKFDPGPMIEQRVLRQIEAQHAEQQRTASQAHRKKRDRQKDKRRSSHRHARSSGRAGHARFPG